MIDRYGLFNRHEIDDTLLILLDDEKVTSEIEKDEVKILYHEDRIVGYSIKNFIRYAKIKYSGIIFLPSKALVDVINSVLKKAGVELLNYKNNSGYAVKKGQKGQNMVFAEPGVFLRDKTLSKGRFCTYFDLFIKSEREDEFVVIDEQIKEGTDFFKTEEK